MPWLLSGLWNSNDIAHTFDLRPSAAWIDTFLHFSHLSSHSFFLSLACTHLFICLCLRSAATAVLLWSQLSQKGSHLHSAVVRLIHSGDVSTEKAGWRLIEGKMADSPERSERGRTHLPCTHAHTHQIERQESVYRVNKRGSGNKLKWALGKLITLSDRERHEWMSISSLCLHLSPSLSLFCCPCLLLSVLPLCLDSSFSLYAPLSALQWQAPSLWGTARQNSSEIIEGTCKFPKDTFYSCFPLALLPVKSDNAFANRHVFHVVMKKLKVQSGIIVQQKLWWC